MRTTRHRSVRRRRRRRRRRGVQRQWLTLVHFFTAKPEPFPTNKYTLNTPSYPITHPKSFLHAPKTPTKCTPYPTESAYVERKSGTSVSPWSEVERLTAALEVVPGALWDTT